MAELPYVTNPTGSRYGPDEQHRAWLAIALIAPDPEDAAEVAAALGLLAGVRARSVKPNRDPIPDRLLSLADRRAAANTRTRP